MTDIVRVLSDIDGLPPVVYEAADEIERLRKHVEQLSDTVIPDLTDESEGILSSHAAFMAWNDMRERAEKAEAERDEWREQHDRKDHRCFELAQRAEKAEDRLKILGAKP